MAYEDLQVRLYEKLGYQPTPAQLKVLRSRARKKLILGGERSGKSETSEKEALPKILTEGKLFWLVARDYEGTRGEWDYLLEDLYKICGLDTVTATKNIDPGEIIVLDQEEGKQIVTKSARYPETLATKAPDGILVCEAAQIDRATYLRLLGRIAEKRGWMNLAGTLEGSVGWFPDLFFDWQGPNTDEGESFSLPTWSNIAIFPLGENDPEIISLREQTPADIFAERYGGVPVPQGNRVVRDFSKETHVAHFEFDRRLPVELAIDPGYAGAHVVLACQQWGERLVVVDEIYLQHIITEEMIVICQQKPWWHNVIGGAIDIAAKQHASMPAPIELWRHQGKKSLRTRFVGQEDGIDLLNTYFKVHPISHKPAIMVSDVCHGLISECGAGRSPVQDGGAWLRNPDTHMPLDRNNHACKALIYLLAVKYGFIGRKERVRERRRSAARTTESR